MRVGVGVCIHIYIYIERERERDIQTDRQTDRKKRKTDRKMGKEDFFNGITHHSTDGLVSRDGMQHTECHLQCFGVHALYCSVLGLY